jgi:hypothetical protein
LQVAADLAPFDDPEEGENVIRAAKKALRLGCKDKSGWRFMHLYDAYNRWTKAIRKSQSDRSLSALEGFVRMKDMNGTAAAAVATAKTTVGRYRSMLLATKEEGNKQAAGLLQINLDALSKDALCAYAEKMVQRLSDYRASKIEIFLSDPKIDVGSFIRQAAESAVSDAVSAGLDVGTLVTKMSKMKD